MDAENREHIIDELVRKSQSGDAEAFGQLYDLLVAPIYRYLYYRAEEVHVEDLTEVVFLKVWENINSYRKTHVSFQAWVFRIAHNLLVDHYRTHRSIAPLNPGIHDTHSDSDPIHTVETSLNNGLLVSALSRLKPNYREILVLKFINELDNPAIARVLGKREGSIRVLQFRALAALKRELEGMGVTHL